MTLATQGMTAVSGIVALGGGVVGDLAGFAASTYMQKFPLFRSD